jgi:hypothetical protein
MKIGQVKTPAGEYLISSRWIIPWEFAKRRALRHDGHIGGLDGPLRSPIISLIVRNRTLEQAKNHAVASSASI